MRHTRLMPIASAAALHFALSTPNFLIQEDMLGDVPWRNDVVEHQLKTKDGYWLRTDAPGLGININEHEAGKYPFKPELFPPSAARARDGAILDW